MKQFSRRWVSAMKNSDPWWRGNKTGPQPAQLSARKEVPASEGKRVESGHPPSWRNRARRPGRPRHWRSGQNTGGDSAALRRAASRHALRSAWVRRTASRGSTTQKGQRERSWEPTQSRGHYPSPSRGGKLPDSWGEGQVLRRLLPQAGAKLALVQTVLWSHLTKFKSKTHQNQTVQVI